MKALELAERLGNLWVALAYAPSFRHEKPTEELLEDATAELRRLAAVEAERDELKAELERIKALEPVGYVNTEETDFEWNRKPWMSTAWEPVYALGSKTA